MSRSAGITASAVAVFAGSALTILAGAAAILGMLLVSSRPMPNVPEHFISFVIIAEAVFAFGFGGWASRVASGCSRPANGPAFPWLFLRLFWFFSLFLPR